MGEYTTLIDIQAHELYSLCDPDNRGYLTRNDLTALKDVLALDEQQLDAVFTSLDKDGDENLTFQEFLEGLGPFLIKKTSKEECESSTSRQESFDESEADEAFRASSQKLEIEMCLSDSSDIREIWKRLRKENPPLLPHFEKLIADITTEFINSKAEYDDLETVLRRRIITHEEEIHRLFEEMECQMKQEREKLLSQEKAKVKEVRSSLESRIIEKDRLIIELMRQQDEVTKSLDALTVSYDTVHQRKEELNNERRLLEKRLEESEVGLNECQEYIEVLKRQAKEERRTRAKATMELSESIALERENLVRQMNELREVNCRLRDEKDERLLKTNQLDFCEESLLENISAINNPLPPRCSKNSLTDSVDQISCRITTSAAVANSTKEERDRRGSSMDTYFNHSKLGSSRLESFEDGSIAEEENELDKSSISKDTEKRHSTKLINKRSLTDVLLKNSFEGDAIRQSPDGAQTRSIDEDSSSSIPQHVFKIISIGNSKVGKSSIIEKFTTGHFNSTISSTVGVDVRMRIMKLDGTLVMLQLWDTAGQERYRSITNQYFRKADGVVLVYDMSLEESFLDLRGWMQCVVDGVDSGTPIMLLANKKDLISQLNPAATESNAGERFAKEYSALFFEISAKTGENLEIAFEEMVRKLRMKEYMCLETSLKLDPKLTSKKRPCCS